MYDFDDEPLLEQAIEWVVINQKTSISGVQRNFRIGYNRAGRLVEMMEAIGIVSAQGFNGNRVVNCSDLQGAKFLLQQFNDCQESPPDMTNVIPFPQKN